MSKRSPAAASKHARTPKIPAKAQRAKRAVVRSPKLSAGRAGEDSPAVSPSKARNTSEQAPPGAEFPAAAFKAPPLVENPAAAVHQHLKRTMDFDFSSAPASLQAIKQSFWIWRWPICNLA